MLRTITEKVTVKVAEDIWLKLTMSLKAKLIPKK